MSTDLQFAVHWLRDQDYNAALALCLDARLDHSQAAELLEPARRPAWLDVVAPVVPLDLVQQTALLRAVEATGWRAPLPELGPLLGLMNRSTVAGSELRHLQRALGQDAAALCLATKMGVHLVETLLEHGYLRLETFRSDARPDELNMQLVFRPGLEQGRGGFFESIRWPEKTWSKGADDAAL
jgi:hypothetical protein